MKTLIEQIKTTDSYAQFNLIPGRIFLDTNALQYLQDFGEYIFEHYRESEECFQARKGKIKKGTRLFNEIEALHDFFIGIERVHFEFALSSSVYKEVSASGDKSFVQWFHDVWDHWEAVVAEYENSEVFSENAEMNYEMAVNNNSLLGSLSEKDKEIVLDAIHYDCDALLTVDRFAKDQNKKMYTFKNYGLMILTPVELMELIKPHQALWC
jgi:hypothetical protein